MANEPSVLDQLKDLDEQRAKLLEAAKNAAIEKANEAIEELNALGYHYRLAEGPALARVLRAKTESETPNRKPNDADCPICNFRTKPSGIPSFGERRDFEAFSPSCGAKEWP